MTETPSHGVHGDVMQASYRPACEYIGIVQYGCVYGHAVVALRSERLMCACAVVVVVRWA